MAVLLLLSGCGSDDGPRELGPNERVAGTSSSGYGSDGSESGDSGDSGGGNLYRYDGTDGNDPFAPGCIGTFYCESGEQVKLHPDSCTSDRYLREAWTVGSNDGGTCEAKPEVELIDCHALCVEQGNTTGSCVERGFECFGEDVTSGVCVCDQLMLRDSDGFDPDTAGCVADATFGECGAVVGDPVGDWCGGSWLYERVVEGTEDETCGVESDEVAVDCNAHCGGAGTCVEATVDCLGQEITSARCSCEDGGLLVRDTDGEDPMTAGCLGEFEVCSDVEAVGAVPDQCADDLFVEEGVVLDGTCGYRDEAVLNCGTVCRDAGLGWGRCNDGPGEGTKIECHGLEVTAHACICDEGPRWYRDDEDGPQPDVPGRTEASVLNAAGCGGALPGPVDNCDSEVLGEVLTEVWVVNGDEQAEPCGLLQCCEGLRETLIDCDHWCDEQGRGSGTCETVQMPHPNVQNFVSVGYCDCEHDAPDDPPDGPSWGSSSGGWG